MPWIRRVPVEDASGLLKNEYDAAIERAGRVWHIVEVMSLNPEAMTASDVEGLRRHGFDDRAVHDAVQVIAYFNYITRVADALGVDREDFIGPWAPPG